MKTRNKALLLALCAVLLVVGSVLGTMAYLTDREEVVNTFTVGNVEILLTETKVGENGVAVSPAERTEEGNAYHLLPGQSYTKDPVVTIVEGSEESYVRMLVKVKNYSNLKAAFPQSKYPTYYNGEDFLLQYLVEGWDPAEWISTTVISVTDDVATYEFRYAHTVTGPEDNKAGVKEGTDLTPLFTSIVVPGTVNNTELANLQNVEITVEAHAIQKAGFADVNQAWLNFS